MTLPRCSKQRTHLFRVPRIFGSASLGLLCGLLLSACGEDGPALSEVKEFDAYPLYYAGEEIGGNELEDISGEDDWQQNPDQRSVGFTFFYGTCEPAADGAFEEGGCAPPVQIQVSNICDRYPGQRWGEPDVFDLRGAKASAGGGGLEILTGRTSVVIFAEGELMRATIRHLRRMGEDATPSRLPPPVPGAIRGELPCQHEQA